MPPGTTPFITISVTRCSRTGGSRRPRSIREAQVLEFLGDDHLYETFILDQQKPGLGRRGVKNIPELFRERRVREWPGDQQNARIEAAIVDNGIACIGGREQDLERRMALSCRVRELPPVHSAGQSDVGEQQPDVGMLFQKVEGNLAVWRLQHLVSKLARDPAGMFPNVLFVLDDEDRLTAPAARHIHRWFFGDGRRVELETGQVHSGRAGSDIGSRPEGRLTGR